MYLDYRYLGYAPLVVIEQHPRVKLGDLAVQERTRPAASSDVELRALVRSEIVASDVKQFLELLSPGSLELLEVASHVVSPLRMGFTSEAS